MHYALMTINNLNIKEQMLKYKEKESEEYDPHGKWDNYGEGRRFANFFNKVDGTRSFVSKIKDIDFQAMKDEMEVAAKNEYSFYSRIQEEEKRISIITQAFGVYKSEKDYIDDRLKESFMPYAFLQDGEWHDMKRYGDQEKWVLAFHEMFNKLSPETELIILDCHI